MPLFLGCGALLVLSCCGCIVFGFIKGQQNQGEFGPLQRTCDGMSADGTGAYPLPEPRAIAMRHESDGRWSYAALWAPRAHAATTRAETSVVLCFEPETEIEDESCAFQTIMMQVNHYRRSHRSVRVRLVEAATGRPIYAGEIVAATPPCTAGSFVPEEGYEFEGSAVSDADVDAWYAAWLASRAH